MVLILHEYNLEPKNSINVSAEHNSDRVLVTLEQIVTVWKTHDKKVKYLLKYYINVLLPPIIWLVVHEHKEMQNADKLIKCHILNNNGTQAYY